MINGDLNQENNFDTNSVDKHPLTRDNWFEKYRTKAWWIEETKYGFTTDHPKD